MFEGARSKLQRANHHIRDFETQFATFVDSKPYTLATDKDAASGKTILRLNLGEPVRAGWALIIGDAIHNLRTAMDHMTWEIVGRDGGTQDRHLKFPTGDSRINFEATCNGMKTPSAAVRDMFKDLEVFPEGKGKTLYALNQLDISDKHIMLMPVIRAADVTKCVVRNASGDPLMTIINTKFIVAGDTGHINVAGLPPGGSLDLDQDAKITPDIVLGPIEAKGGYLPIRSMLREFRYKVSKTIDAIEQRLS